jgi:cytochrome P450
MRDYVHAAAAKRAREPQDDLLTVLSRAESEQVITGSELVGMSVLVFYAGIMTTAAFLSNSVKNLDLHREQRDLLIAQPALIQDAVEELLRFDSPVQSVSRVTTEEVSLHDRVIPAGARVLVLYGSANRDETRWQAPDALNISREHKQHLVFGVGLHHCLGSSLARLEGRVLFEELLRLIPDYETCGNGKRLFAPHERGFESLPIAFKPTSLDLDPASADLTAGAAQRPA